jgi:hypothetical protein
MGTFEALIREFISEVATQIAQAVKAELSSEPRRGSGAGSAAKATRAAVASAPKAAKSGGRSLPTHCVYPDCDNAQKGPRFSFLCEEHVGIPKAEKKQYLDAWKAARNGKASRTPAKPAKEKTGRGKRRGVDEATMTRVLKVIEDAPGLRSEQIYEKLPIPTELARKALTKLRETKRVKTKGEKRSMTYAAA